MAGYNFNIHRQENERKLYWGYTVSLPELKRCGLSDVPPSLYSSLWHWWMYVVAILHHGGTWKSNRPAYIYIYSMNVILRR